MNVTFANSNTQVYQTNKTQATKATTAYEATSKTKETDKMSEMQEKYKDIYTPIPDTYSKADQELQNAKVYEAYPNYIGLKELWNKSMSFNEAEPIKLGIPPTKEQVEDQKQSSQRMENWLIEKYGSMEAFNSMNKDVQEIRNKYPVNHWKGDNEKEFTRFENASVYEGLEDGKTLEQAKIDARNLTISFMDVDNNMTDASNKNFLDTLVKAGRADPNAKQPEYTKNEIDFNAPNNSVMDLRKYGIDGDWEFYKILENQQAMTSEIEKKINQFNFMLSNEDLVTSAYSKLDSSFQDLGNNAGYKQLIRDEYMPDMKEALDIFKNYKIYDSVDIKG